MIQALTSIRGGDEEDGLTEISEKTLLINVNNTFYLNILKTLILMF